MVDPSGACITRWSWAADHCRRCGACRIHCIALPAVAGSPAPIVLVEEDELVRTPWWTIRNDVV